jgi:hypothetical protein
MRDSRSVAVEPWRDDFTDNRKVPLLQTEYLFESLPNNASRSSGIIGPLPNFSLSRHYEMNSYAAGPESRVYHIVENRGGYTLCGLRVSTIKAGVLSKGFGILLSTPGKPRDRRLCRHCERLAKKELPVPSKDPE